MIEITLKCGCWVDHDPSYNVTVRAIQCHCSKHAWKEFDEGTPETLRPFFSEDDLEGAVRVVSYGRGA